MIRKDNLSGLLHGNCELFQKIKRIKKKSGKDIIRQPEGEMMMRRVENSKKIYSK